MNKCIHCGEPCKSKFCNNSCSAKYNNVRKAPRTAESKRKTSEALKGRTISDTHRNNISRAMSGRTCDWLVGKALSEEIKQKIRVANTGRIVSNETREKLRVIAKERNFGGHTSKRRCMFIKNNGEIVHLQSSYETRFAEILESLGIDWSRPNSLTWYDDNGASHRYYPDFKIGDIYIDTKNDYLAIKDLPKINAVIRHNSIDLRIVTKNMINEEYVKSLISPMKV